MHSYRLHELTAWPLHLKRASSTYAFWWWIWEKPSFVSHVHAVLSCIFKLYSVSTHLANIWLVRFGSPFLQACFWTYCCAARQKSSLYNRLSKCLSCIPQFDVSMSVMHSSLMSSSKHVPIAVTNSDAHCLTVAAVNSQKSAAHFVASIIPQFHCEIAVAFTFIAMAFCTSKKKHFSVCVLPNFQ